MCSMKDAHATLREYDEAVQDGNMDLAKRIQDANPDLFPHTLEDLLAPICNASTNPLHPVGCEVH